MSDTAGGAGQVGNEERAMEADEYPAHYRLITQQLWAQHPEVVVVASGRWGPSVDGSPCLAGQRCDAWDDHYYRTPDQMVRCIARAALRPAAHLRCCMRCC